MINIINRKYIYNAFLNIKSIPNLMLLTKFTTKLQTNMNVW